MFCPFVHFFLDRQKVSLKILPSVRSITGWHFQPGEGTSRGLLRDCTTLPFNRSQHLLVEWPLFRYPWLLVTTGRWGQCSECSVPASTASQRTGCSWCIMEVWGNRFCETPCTDNNGTITILSCASRSILFSVKTQNSTQFVSHKRRWWLSRGPEKDSASTKMTICTGI